MARASTIRDVAKAAGVAIGTVSRVLNGHKSVSAEVRQKVLHEVGRLSYEPDSVARSMRLGVTHTVACAIRDISIPGFGSFVNAASDILHEHGYTLLLAITEERKEREMELLRLFGQRRVDGIIMTFSSEEDVVLARTIKQMPIPMVLFDRDVPLEVDAVTIDHRRGTRTATEYLLGLGHRRIALLTGRDAIRPARERIGGFVEAYAGRSMTPDPSLIRTGAFSAEFGLRETSLLLSTSERPTALICGGMGMFPGVMRAIAMHSLRIPDDISVIAGADSDLASLVTPALTAVRWSMSEVGRLAVQLLLERLQALPHEEARRVMVPTELVIRGSCAPPS